jgi:hypothetical protein
LLDYTNVMQMRKRYGEVLDQLEDLKERLEKLEDRLLHVPNDEYTKRRVDLLNKKNYMLIEEEQKLKSRIGYDD